MFLFSFLYWTTKITNNMILNTNHTRFIIVDILTISYTRFITTILSIVSISYFNATYSPQIEILYITNQMPKTAVYIKIIFLIFIYYNLDCYFIMLFSFSHKRKYANLPVKYNNTNLATLILYPLRCNEINILP